jgi:hypothetical protein
MVGNFRISREILEIVRGCAQLAQMSAHVDSACVFNVLTISVSTIVRIVRTDAPELILARFDRVGDV